MTALSEPAFPIGAEAATTPERRGIPRDGVRMLVTDVAAGRHDDRLFRDLPAMLQPGDVVVVNDSSTRAAALVARRVDGSTFALHLSTPISGGLWIAEPRAAVLPGLRASLPAAASATFLAPLDAANPRLWYVALDLPLPLDAYLERFGAPIRYRYVTEPVSIEAYQTMFARVAGSAEMPSAARPFTPAVVEALTAHGIALATITLHAGVSSPERQERPASEPFAVPASTVEAIATARKRGGRVVAIGTTVVRALETAGDGTADGIPLARSGWTDLIVTGERGRAVVDALLTGFHEPQASHLDLLRAFAGDAELHAAYVHAVAAGYAWHEFGDVHLIVAPPRDYPCAAMNSAMRG